MSAHWSTFFKSTNMLGEVENDRVVQITDNYNNTVDFMLTGFINLISLAMNVFISCHHKCELQS